MKNIKIDLQKIKEELNDNYVMVLDTETIGLTNRIIYNLGYKIFDLTNGKVVVKNDFVVQQFYDNRPLMMTAYYKDKKPLYTKLMKGKKAKSLEGQLEEVYRDNTYIMKEAENMKADIAIR
jgi:hypothetical protein